MKKFNKVCISAVSLAVLLGSVSAFGAEEPALTVNLTEDYVKWQSLSEKEKEESLMPRITTVNMPEEYVVGSSSYTNLRTQIQSGNFVKNTKTALVGASGYQLSRYNLNDQSNVDIKVKHQGKTNECWAFSMTSVLETNLALTQNVKKEFSPRHMDYSMVRTFTDGVKQDTLNREAGQGGLGQFAIAYLTNGSGAVLESQMPFVNSEEKISMSELNKPVDTFATETVTFPGLYKRYTADNGELVYTNGATGSGLVIYEESEVKAFRNSIKNHIVNYGAITAVTAGNEEEYYNNPTQPARATAYFCNDPTVVRDHAITIVGWDDNYSRDNFTGAAKPKANGAYICLNSYGTENFGNGYLYVSYEDSLIETYLYGIKSAKTVDYDTIYQYNPTGSNTAVGMNNTAKGYIAEVFDRDASKKEKLTYVGIELPSEMSLKIYVNPTGNNPAITACTLVATTQKLSAGYHRIPVTATNLTGSKFAIVIEGTPTNGKFDFAIEIAVPDGIYSTIKGNPGKCLFSSSGYTWSSLSAQEVDGFDMTTADMTIKAFTTDGYVSADPVDEPSNPPADNPSDEPGDTPSDNPSDNPGDTPTDEPGDNPSDNPTDSPSDNTKVTITSKSYKIKGTDVYNVVHDTTIKDFKKNITTNSETVEFYDSANKKIEETEKIKTGTKMKLSDGTTYLLIVRGDTNYDGTLTLTDLSKIVAHYGDENKYGLTGSALKAADLNVDGKVTLTDISQLVNILGYIK